MSKMITKISVAIALLLFATLSLHAKDIPAYYDAPYASAKVVKQKLGQEGFKVLATYSPANKSHLKVVVFTNKKLISIASKKNRGFAAIQRVMINSKAKTVRVTNTEYWLRAFMQKSFKAGSCKSIKASIGKALGKLTPTKDLLDSSDLAGYHYALSMPYYEDMLELKSGKITVDPKKKVFELKLANGSTLVGVRLGGTEKFINAIGEENALALPYTILIEGGKAYALHAKYYLAVSYPLLSLGQFMKISSVPDAIEKKLKDALK